MELFCICFAFNAWVSAIKLLLFKVNLILIIFLKHLCISRCDVNVPDHHGQTPLDKAIEKEFIEFVSVLLQNGADPNIATSSDVYPLRLAVWKKNPDIVKVRIG